MDAIKPYVPTFCKNCGVKLIQKRIHCGFSEDTGEEVFRTDVRCPHHCSEYEKPKTGRPWFIG